jgi:YidC/Oxa1 family membrane protein insertase
MMSIWGNAWNAIIWFLNYLLQAFYNFTGNYGVAIILLTLLVKVLLLPLTIKQTRSMIAMQKIQPEIKKLQEKYKDDKEKLSQEMMKFYKENKVNPLGGCLPLILQLPIFFALYTVLRKYLLTPPAIVIGNTFAAFKGIPTFVGGLPGVYAPIPIIKNAGFLWINNLADSTRLADPTFIFIIILAASTWYSQKQVMTDPRQKNMMIIMPLITAFIGWSLPAGVVLYWMTTNILQIMQQWAMEYYDKKHPERALKGKEEKDSATQKTPAKEKGDVAAKSKGVAKEKAPPRGTGKPGGGKKKPAQSSAGQKGKATNKQKSAPPKGGKASSQVRRPKSPPPKPKKSQKGNQGKGGVRKK